MQQEANDVKITTLPFGLMMPRTFPSKTPEYSVELQGGLEAVLVQRVASS